MKILSCGAGMQSTALALMSCENAHERIHRLPLKFPLVPIYDLVVFCDLGFEPPWVMANCWACARFIDPSFCELYESDVDDMDPSNHGNQNCCRSNMVYQVLYGDDPKAVEYFLLRDKSLLDDEPALLAILIRFFPAVKAMAERPDFVLSKTQIQAAQA